MPREGEQLGVAIWNNQGMGSEGIGGIALSLNDDEAGTLMASLRRYLLHWERHVAEDEGRTHSLDQLETVRRDVGRLLYRLETARAPAGSRVQYSPDAIPPESPGSDAASVDEPNGS